MPCKSENYWVDPRTDWEPNLPSAQPGTFTLPDLLRFAGVLGYSGDYDTILQAINSSLV
jgi:hypothetical protein